MCIVLAATLATAASYKFSDQAALDSILSYSEGSSRLSALIADSLSVIDATLTAALRSGKDKMLSSLESFISPESVDVLRTGAAAFSFNGGKDSMVLLYLIRAVLHRRHHEKIETPAVPLFRVILDEEPEGVEDFVRGILDHLDLTLRDYSEGGLVAASAARVAVAEHDRRHHFLSAVRHAVSDANASMVFLGVRADDPTGSVSQYAVNAGKPDIMRVTPIMKWEFADVWEFLFRFHIPFCSLYGDGYASMGSKKNSRRHERLLIENFDVDLETAASRMRENGVGCRCMDVNYAIREALERGEEYLPAWFLPVGCDERAGRGALQPTPGRTPVMPHRKRVALRHSTLRHTEVIE